MKKLFLKNLVKQYSKKIVVKDVSLEVNSGEVVGLLGPNGAGKTTSFYMAVGMIKPNKGQIFLEDEEITNYPMYIRARKGIAYLPQEASIFRKLTAKENILAILELLPKDKDLNLNNRALELLKEFGISRLENSKAYVLSGGERRRLEIARLFASSPSFVLLDEPFAGIDPLAVNDIQNVIKQLKNKNMGVLISDHNVRETLEVCDRAYIMHDGQILESGRPEDIIKSKETREKYLGEKFRM